VRILQIISTLNPSYGGPVEVIKQLGRYFTEHGVTVEVATCGDRADDPWISAFPLHVYPLGPGFGKYTYTSRLRPWLETHGRSYDAWIINGLWQYQSVGAAPVAQRLGIPYFVYAHGMLDPWSRRAHPLKYLKKFAYWLLFEQWVLRRARVVCFTAGEEAELAAAYFPIGSWTPFVVGAGIVAPAEPTQQAVAAFVQRFPELQNKRLWVFLGRIHPKKGLDLLFNAFRELRLETSDIHVIVAGPGDRRYVSSLKTLAANLGISSNVSFTGPLYGEDKWVAFNVSELFILPSHQDNFGIAVAEALAMKVPVCISDKVNIWREIMAADAGLICSDDVPSLVETLNKWNHYTGVERKAFSKRAITCFQKHFRVETAASRLIERISREVAGGSHG